VSPGQVLPVSARSDVELERAATALADLLEREPGVDLADLAHTLQVGRAHEPHRLAVVCRDREGAVAGLRAGPGRSVVAAPGRPVVFLFPGEGSGHADMAEDLYRAEPCFRAWVDRCRGLAEPPPALFMVSYALARTWLDWGVRPAAMIGHGSGECVAACVAGVLSPEDAMALVAASAPAVGAGPEAAMLSVRLPEGMLPGRLPDGVRLASVDGPSLCVVGGPRDAVLALRDELSGSGVSCRLVRGTPAPRSGLPPPVVPASRLRAPDIPLVSGVTGDWMRAAEATDPGYWARRAGEPVRFAAGLARVLELANAVPLEVGPGTALSALVREATSGMRRAVASMRRPSDPNPDRMVLLAALGALWEAGVTIDWAARWGGEARRRVDLPSGPPERTEVGATPFERHIASMCAELLDSERIGLDDDLFDLGADSMTATRLHARLVEFFGVDVPIAELFERPTVTGLATRIEALLLQRIEQD
jgi:acyl transferase domain-containing protein/acyl carrier protein